MGQNARKLDSASGEKGVKMDKISMTLSEIQSEVNDILRATVEVCDRNHITYYCQAGTVLGAVRHKGAIPWDYDADIIVPNNQINDFVKCCLKELPKEYWVNFHTAPTGGFCQFPRIGKRGYSTEHLHLDVFQLIGLPNDREGQLALIEEAVIYRDEMNVYKRGLRGIASCFKHGRVRLGLETAARHCRKDTSFLDKMDELCARYPYEQAEYVMNPFGRYREKNIFKKSVYGEGKIVQYSDFSVRIPSETDFYLHQYYKDYMKYPPQNVIDKAMNEVFVVEKIGVE